MYATSYPEVLRIVGGIFSKTEAMTCRIIWHGSARAQAGVYVCGMGRLTGVGDA